MQIYEIPECPIIIVLIFMWFSARLMGIVGFAGLLTNDEHGNSYKVGSELNTVKY